MIIAYYNDMNQNNLKLIKSILIQWIDTYDDPKGFPFEEYPDLWAEVQQVKALLQTEDFLII